MKQRHRKYLTPEQKQSIKQMLDAKIARRRICSQLGVSERALLREFYPADYARKCSISPALTPRLVKIIDVPEHVLADRERRLSMPHDPMRNLTGDPEPGRSALDKRRSTQCPIA